jgi:hypothetical protein
MGFKSEVLALAFGALLIFVTFGDAHIYWFIGNLDTIFGLTFWRVLDVFYPVASAVVFLLYGWVKGNGLKFNPQTQTQTLPTNDYDFFFHSYLLSPITQLKLHTSDNYCKIFKDKS